MRAFFPLFLAVALTTSAATTLADDSSSRPPRKRIRTCDPYAEKCPACADCSRCKACSKEGNRCSVKRAQLGFAPR